MAAADWLTWLFRAEWPLVGMVHLWALPGSPDDAGDLEATIAAAVDDARALEAGGVSAIMVENFGDVPFFPDAVPAVTVAAMTRAVAAVRAAVALPIGVNVLRNDALAALAIAHVTGADFLRVNVLSGAMVTDQGVIEGQAHRLLRERRALGARVRVLADVHVKHAVPLAPLPIAQAALDTVKRGGADALIVSGTGTGAAPDLDAVRAVCEALGGVAPVLVGSGLSEVNIGALRSVAQGAIVGTSLKRDGQVHAPVEESRVRALVAAVAACGRVP